MFIYSIKICCRCALCVMVIAIDYCILFHANACVKGMNPSVPKVDSRVHCAL